MYRFCLILIIIVLNIVNLQGQWEVLNEGIKTPIQSIDFIDHNNGWMAGYGLIMRTEDGGLTWQNIPTNKEWNILGIDFISDTEGWAICRANDIESDLILRTENGGYDWIIMDQQADGRYDDLHVLNKNDIIVGSNEMIKMTTSGGTIWIDISPENANGLFNSVRFYSKEIGLVGGVKFTTGFNQGSIWRTVNGGSSWEEIIFSEFNNIFNLQFTNNTVAYFIAENWEDYLEFYLCRTRDLAQNREIIFQSAYRINSYFLSDNDNIYISVADSLSTVNLLKSPDGGRTWEKIFSLPYWQTTYINLNEEDSGIIIAQLSGPDGRGTSEQLILSDRYDEKQWLTRHFSYNLTDVCFLNPSRGLTVGGYSIFHGPTGGDVFSSTDGGLTWSPDASLPGMINSIEFASDSVGYVSTENWSFLLFKTTDLGMNWNIVYENNFDSTGFEFYGSDIFLTRDDTVWMAGSFWEEESSGAAIIFSSDGGKNWDFQWKYHNDELSWHKLEALTVTNTATWAVGNEGLIVKIVNPDSFKITKDLTDLPLNVVTFSDEYHGWIAGGYGYWENFQPLLLKTTDGGVSWIEQENFPYISNDLFFRDSLQGWAVGYDDNEEGVIVATTDGGLSWSLQADHLSGPLNAIHFVGDYGWAVGQYGQILKTDNGGVNWIDDHDQSVKRATFQLEQNYPNPFNPITMINYQLPMTNYVDLSIYNILGQRVATLVSEKQQPGHHQLQWGASDFASGVYYYRLEAGGFVDVKKMVIIK